jgi:uncharacterized membrane protein/glutaredoxin
MNIRYLSQLLFLIVSGLGSLYLLAESVLQAFGKSICATEGCKVVAQYTRFGDLSMALLGLGMLTLLAVLAHAGLRSESPARDRWINFLLVASLAGEGFFVGEQLFRLHALCVFCMSVFGIYVALGVLRLLAGHREMLAGFGALAAVLSLFYLVLPAGGTALPKDVSLVLFYSPDCKHCSEVRKEMEELKIEAAHVLVQEHAATLKNLGITEVPTLLVNGRYERSFLTGTDAIRRYLASCRPASRAAAISPRPAPSVKPAAGPGLPNIIAPLGGPAALFNPPPDDGLCKEDTKCD